MPNNVCFVTCVLSPKELSTAISFARSHASLNSAFLALCLDGVFLDVDDEDQTLGSVVEDDIIKIDIPTMFGWTTTNNSNISDCQYQDIW